MPQPTGDQSVGVSLAGPGMRSPGKTPRRSDRSVFWLSSYHRPQAPTRLLITDWACPWASASVTLSRAAVISWSASARSACKPASGADVASPGGETKVGIGEAGTARPGVLADG